MMKTRRYRPGEHDGPIIEGDFEVVGEQTVKTRAVPRRKRRRRRTPLRADALVGAAIGLGLAYAAERLQEQLSPEDS